MPAADHAQERAFWAVVPAAGSGSRMGADRPKQYLSLAGKSILEHSVAALLAEPRIRRIVVVTAPDDRHWARLALASHPRVCNAPGGAERWQSVRSGLQALAKVAGPGDPVLVHDAARPCLHPDDLRCLLDDPEAGCTGGLLAVPVRDTLKRDGGGGRISGTVDRTGLWQAQTPQMFPWDALLGALSGVTPEAGVTDESAAMERVGWRPRLVAARADNLKVTHPEDLPLAAAILAQRAGGCAA